MTTVKNYLDQVQELSLNANFVKSVAKTLKENGCSVEEWEANKVYFLMTFASKIINKQYM